ncbi:MAG: sigma-70 family RNA polymerase sigma factor [Bacteroidales bacterium]|nr:sigma-70 family RNA polymerase sigma factor [Bacteroidales bacterium]MBN2698954.1 sigma-70 family RNA polymerase sigma factor [Bacteroidales bacterium]
MKSFSEEHLLNGIVRHNSEVLIYIYDTYFPLIEGYILQNSGTTEEAEDVFQEGLLIVYRKLKNENLILRCKFSTYLYSVCRRIFHQERKKRYLQIQKIKDQPYIIEDSGPDVNPVDQEALAELIHKYLKELSPDCQKIIQLTINECTVDEIREALQYNSNHHTIDRKYRCKKSLIKKITEDPSFKKLKDEIR